MEWPEVERCIAAGEDTRTEFKRGVSDLRGIGKTLCAKAEGAFLALAAGDALGWPQEMPRNVPRHPAKGVHIEFEKWIRRSGGRFQPFEETILPGEYSDDTQLTLAVARSRTNHGSAWWKAFTRVELPLWTLYERGGGGATKRAARAWADGHPPWKSDKKNEVHQYFSAGGNGVAMRVLPHALFLAEQEGSAVLMHDVVLDGSATHGHPRALLGATVYAYAAWSLARRSSTLRFGELLDILLDEASEWSKFPKSDRDGGSWFEAAEGATGARYPLIWEQTTCEMRDLLEVARKGLQAGALADDHSVLKDLGCFGRTKGAGTSSAAAAVYLVARHAAQPVQGVLRAAFEKGADTDTLAAMAGGLMGCLCGVDWLPTAWFQVQDAEYLRNIASRTALGPCNAHQRPVEPLPHLETIFSDLPRKGEHELVLGNTTRAHAVVLPDPKPIAKSIAVRAWRLSTSDGQTMYITKVGRLAREAFADQPRDTPEPDQLPSSVRAPADTATDSDADPKNSLYVEFCRQLRSIFGSDEIKRKDVETTLGLVPGQVRKWLERAEQDGQIQWTSKKPVKFTLSSNRKFLL